METTVKNRVVLDGDAKGEGDGLTKQMGGDVTEQMGDGQNRNGVVAMDTAPSSTKAEEQKTEHQQQQVQDGEGQVMMGDWDHGTSGENMETTTGPSEQALQTAPQEHPPQEHPPQEHPPQEHPPQDPEAFYLPDHQQERKERQERRDYLRGHRNKIDEIPINHLWEIPGRPSVVFAMKDYRRKEPQEGRKAARDELPFLFKAFEQGQVPPPRPGTKRADLPRAATIHEYLDWTVTASEPQDPDELDFEGFRVLALYPRFRLNWPPPSEPYNTEMVLKHPQLGAPKPPIPHLQVHQKPICAATVRLGPGWLEVPFYATQELRRNKGNGRALLEAIEDICRSLSIPRILLCSTDDSKVKGTWSHLGFQFTSKEELEKMGVTRHDLLHMDNTVQMHKDVSRKTVWASVVVKHGTYKHRVYYLPGGGHVPPIPQDIIQGTYFTRKRMYAAGKPSKPAKKPRKVKA